MPETATHTKDKRMPRSTQSSRNVPPGSETVPRFAPSPSFLGSAFAEEILEDFRQGLEGVNLKAETPRKRTRKKG